MMMDIPSFRLLRAAFLLMILSVALNAEGLANIVSAQIPGLFSYEFVVDEEGFTKVNITYTTNGARGSSWVLVPKFSEWTNHTVRGKVTECGLRDAGELTGVPYFFYEALWFFYDSDGSEFEMNVQFNLSTAAMIIEPDGVFYSPQIGFEEGRVEAEVTLPEGFSIKQGEALALGSAGAYRPSSLGSDYVLFDNLPETENSFRIEIGFRTSGDEADLRTLQSGVFAFETVPRYEGYAEEILTLFNRTYGGLVELFNVTLETAEVRFFLPEFNSLFSPGGYVPFVSRQIGDIHINILYTRYVRGYIEVIALHELVHHFLWKAGISPQTLLWFHEGMAEYISLEIANTLGYEGSRIMKEELEEGVSQLQQIVGDDFGFITQWSPSRQPENTWSYYVASYCVVSRLAEPRGGLEYYNRFFRLIKGKNVDSNAAIGYYLGLAANESVADTLNRWGFEIPDLYRYAPLLSSAEEVLGKISPLHQPYKFLAELLYRQALLNANEESIAEMQLYLAAALFIARLAPLLTLVTISGVLFGAIVLALSSRGVFSKH